MNTPKRKLDARGVNKGYPKRLIKKYGNTGQSHHENIADKPPPHFTTETKMPANPQNKPPKVQTASPAAPAKTSALKHSEGLEKSSDALKNAKPMEPTSTTNTPAAGITTEQLKTKVPEKTEKRPEPQTPAEFIEAFYKGQTKSLTESTVNNIKRKGLALDADSRGSLLRQAQGDDAILDKTRKLMLIATEEERLKPLGELLMLFAVDVICLHKSIQSKGMQVKIFPNYSDESDLEDAWKALRAMQEKEVAAVVDTGLSQTSGAPTQKQPDARSAVGVGRNEKGAANSNAFGKVQRNAFWCSVIWRIHKKHTPFAQAMLAMRNTIFYAPTPTPTTATEREAALLEAMALIPEKEDAKIALLLQWQVTQQAAISENLKREKQHTSSLTEQLAQVTHDKDMALEIIAKLEKNMSAVLLERQQLQSQIGVVKTHGQADYEALRSLSLRVVKDAVNQLESVSTALGRDPPKVAIARELLNTVTDALRNADKKLGET